MTLYGPSLFLVVLGGLMAAFNVLLLASTPVLLKRLDRLPPAERPGAILLCRFLPAGLSLLLVLGVFLPAWLRYEPANTGETASAGLVGLAFLALLPILSGFHRAFRMYLATRDRLLLWRRRARNAPATSGSFEVLEVKSDDLVLCVGGYLKPTIYASAAIMNSLEPEEISAALRHEVSHASARDPMRLLWMASCPDFLQFLGLDKNWRLAFSTACEFAADEDAGRGNPEVALDLASALLKVARLRTRPLGAEALIDVAVSSAFVSHAGLEARVEALTNPARPRVSGLLILRPSVFAAFAIALCALGTIFSPQVHELTEGVARLLGS